MSTSLHTDEQLRTSLDKLERCLEMPIVPGRFEHWLESCRQLCGELEAALQSRVEEGHGELLEEIASQDPELLPRVEQLLAEDTALLKLARELRQDAESLANHAGDESAADERVQEFTKEALSYVLRIRTQETAIVTWYQEAFNRDRGIAD